MKTVYDTVIVGGGIFGCVIAANLIKVGQKVLILESKEQRAGSKPAACLIKPSWLSSMNKQELNIALETLDVLYGLTTLNFDVGKIATQSVFWVEPKKILEGVEKFASKFINATQYNNAWLIRHEPLVGNYSLSLTAKNVVIAAGIWSDKLAPMTEKLRGYAGAAYLWENETIQTPFIKPWAPYKQLVGFNRGDGLWVGDGSSILYENWRQKHDVQTLQRCSNAVDKQVNKAQTLFGVRPYTKRKVCYLEETSPGFWIATGGAKNGTAAAALCAHEIEKRSNK